MRKKAKIAIIQFPGTNCELETLRAVKRNGMEGEIFRWNEKRSLGKFDGAILAGGFSYEDRGRSGLIASKDPLIKEIYKLSKRGGAVLGICNGAQILVETGLTPNFDFGKSVIALTRNRRVKDGVVMGSGYFNEWIHIKRGSAKPNAFNLFTHPIRIPIAHGEGRFFSEDEELLKKITKEGLNAFVYCDEKGEVIPTFPTNPNGSVLNLAGITNLDGNVCALMPHPERSENGDVIFASMRKWMGGGVKQASQKLKVATPLSKLHAKPKVNLEFFVKLKITDNEALSVGKASGLSLEKMKWFGIKGKASKEDLEKMIRGGDLLNTEKEDVWVKSGSKVWKFAKDKGLIDTKFKLPRNRILAKEKETSLDEARKESVNKTLGKKIVKNLVSGIIWGEDENKVAFEKALRNNFFHHPSSYNLIKI
jgi:phosphoribosylformylglycinamidine synthase I